MSFSSNRFRPTLGTVLPLAGIMLLAGCGDSQSPDKPHETKPATETTSKPATSGSQAQTTGDILDRVIANERRGEGHRNRDEYRNPKQTLQFYGIRSDMTVVEVFPGGGYYTKIIAPYLATGDGAYIAMNNDPGTNDRRVRGLEAFKSTFSNKDEYGSVTVALIGGDGPAVEPGSADAVLTFRNVHNWMRGDTTDKMFAEFYSALKPGGILGVVEHRGDPTKEQDPKGATGYVREDVVIAMAQKAGFELEEKSEINANPKDDRDHPYGVWTLPPVRRSSSTGAPNPTFDRAKYDAIGESDRMTLKFRKPNGADGALLE